MAVYLTIKNLQRQLWGEATWVCNWQVKGDKKNMKIWGYLGYEGFGHSEQSHQGCGHPALRCHLLELGISLPLSAASGDLSPNLGIGNGVCPLQQAMASKQHEWGVLSQQLENPWSPRCWRQQLLTTSPYFTENGAFVFYRNLGKTSNRHF